jgi:hypothetical protein
LNQVHAFPNSGARGESLEPGSADAESGSGLQVAQPDAAELERRGDHPFPERPQFGHNAQLDPCFGMATDQIVELDDLNRVNRFA